MEREVHFRIELDINPSSSEFAGVLMGNPAILEQLIQRELLWAIKTRLDVVLEREPPEGALLLQVVQQLLPQSAPQSQLNELWDKLDNAVCAMIKANAASWNVEEPARRAA